MKQSRIIYIPKQFDHYITLPDIPGLEIYKYKTTIKGVEKPAAIMFRGKAQKPTNRYYYRDEARRDEAIQQFIDDERKVMSDRAERRAKKAAFTHNLKPGDILYSSWGYDQTNIDFYQVTQKVGKKSVKIRPIRSTVDHHDGCQSNYMIPEKNGFTGGEMLKRVTDGYNGGHWITLNSFSGASDWNGKPIRETDSYSGH